MGRSIALALVMVAAPLFPHARAAPAGPETVAVRHGDVVLHALLWRPQGHTPYPGILFDHGSGRSRADLARLGPYEDQATMIGPVFASHGYAFLYLFRQGVGLSADQGTSAVDLLARELEAYGQDARNRLQIQLLEGREMADARAGLAFLRGLTDIEPRQIAAVGDSFGSSLTVLMADREPDLRALVMFSTAGNSWDNSSELRALLTTAASHAASPMYFIHAENDYAVGSGRTLDAERARVNKPHQLSIYPPIGQTPEDGHSFLYRGVRTWEPDVFAFLSRYLMQ